MRRRHLALAIRLAGACAVMPMQVAVGAPGAEPSGELAAYRKAEKAEQEVWDRMPMGARRIAFVRAPVKQFGAYEPRGDNVFRETEKVITYIEPVGFVFRDVGDGVLAYGFKVDLVARKADGSPLANKPDYAKLDSRTRSRKQEVEFDSSLDVKGLAPGTYGLEFTFRDLYSDKTMVVNQTFQVVK